MDKPEVQITEPVIGLRRWNFTSEGELYSPIIEGPWTPGVNVAKCIKSRVWQPWRHDGSAPVDGCSCGIYAHHEDKLQGDTTGIWGVIRGWGNVRVHPDGWRAEKAELLAIFSANQTQELLEKVSQRYDVPILPTSFHRPDMLEAEFGPFVPKSIRPDRTESSKTSYMIADYLLWLTLGSITVGTIGFGVVRIWQQLRR